MLYLHDVWVNWFEGEENGYNVCSFHEWRKTDNIELLDQVPLLKLEKEVFDFIENDMNSIPRDLLEKIYNKAYYRKNHTRVVTDYCAVITDGEQIMAFDTIGYEIPIRKSRLVPRQEQLVHEMIENATPFLINENQLPNQKSRKKEYHILSPHPKEMVGLTRSERAFKLITYMALDQIHQASESEIRYWFLEWSDKTLEEIQKSNKEILWNQLYADFQKGWNSKHFDFGKAIIKGQPFFEKLWEMEEKELIAI